MRERHHLRTSEDDDFNIRTPEELIRAQLATANVFTLLLGGAASGATQATASAAGQTGPMDGYVDALMRSDAPAAQKCR